MVLILLAFGSAVDLNHVPARLPADWPTASTGDLLVPWEDWSSAPACVGPGCQSTWPPCWQFKMLPDSLRAGESPYTSDKTCGRPWELHASADGRVMLYEGSSRAWASAWLWSE